MLRIERNLLLLSALLCLSLTSCDWDDSYSDKAFLSHRYRLEACADIHGQDPYQEIWFSDYHGTPYSDLFDLSFEKTYLDFRVEVINQRAVGKGRLVLTWKEGGIYQDCQFRYYCSARDNNWGGVVYAFNVPEDYGLWVYSIYWCRLNIFFIDPEVQEEITLTFHFRGGEPNPYPEEFKHSF